MRPAPTHVLLFGLCGCGGPVVDPLPEARLDVADDVLRDSSRALSISDTRVTSDQSATFGTMACPAATALFGVFFGLLAASSFGPGGLEGERRLLVVPLFGGPTALGLAFAAWTSATTDVTVDLQSRTVTRTTLWLVGFERDEVRRLDDVSCTTKEERDADDDVVACYVMLSAREGPFSADWILLAYRACPPAEELCEHLAEKFHATRPSHLP